MKKKDIQKTLENILLHDAKMDVDVYKHELAGEIIDLTTSMHLANNNCIFALTVKEQKGKGMTAAMVLIEKSGEVHRNEAAKDKLKKDWHINYAKNIHGILPNLVQQIKIRQLGVMGLSIVTQH